MVVSTKGRYALRVMIDIAKYGEESYVALGDIAKRQGLSEKYLESIIKMLVQNKLVKGLRGKNGGYKLTKDASEITAWDVISITENDFYVVACMDPNAPKCDRIAQCVTLPMWKEFSEEMQKFFQKYTISELASKEVNQDDSLQSSLL
ncbi:MAG: Rrf2 family transcriptional regulator [Clostridiales bacterium]|nr:Rrf2 family transcriptional regulator [Clostridiales bacterium]